MENIYYLDHQPDDVKFLVASHVRMKILLSLYDGPKKLGYLREATGIASSTLIHGLRQLEEKRWLVRKGDNSYLTSKGKVVLMNLIKLMEKFKTFDIQLNFWKNHNLNGIPLELQKDIDALRESYLVEVTLDNLEEPFTRYLQMLSEAKNMNAVLPVFFSRHTDAIHKILLKGGTAKLILAEDIFKQFMEQFDWNELQKYIKSGDLEIMVISENIEVVCVVSDIFVSLGLFFEDGVYDTSRLLMGHEMEALAWGDKLFQYYEGNGKKMDLKTIKQL
jgi:predicted transcriptional regulator